MEWDLAGALYEDREERRQFECKVKTGPPPGCPETAGNSYRFGEMGNGALALYLLRLRAQPFTSDVPSTAPLFLLPAHFSHFPKMRIFH